MSARIAIVGGGLSGLALALRMEKLGLDYVLIEARDRVGGRILTANGGGARFDMGPTWFWEEHLRITRLISELGLTRFEQRADGDALFEDGSSVQRMRGQREMAGSYRVAGGMSALTDAMASLLAPQRVRLGAPVTRIENGDKLHLTLGFGEGIFADRVVLSLPPRLAGAIEFAPVLPQHTLLAMGAVPTWMAGQAKAVAVYKTAFWREQGLSGDAMSRVGPMVEIHDASTIDGSDAALFGFVGVPPSHRMDEAALRATVIAQLVRVFGPDAGDPVSVHLKDWARDPFTATQADQAPLFEHPRYHALSDLWDGRILFSGTEVAPQFGGFLEGALEAAENTPI